MMNMIDCFINFIKNIRIICYGKEKTIRLKENDYLITMDIESTKQMPDNFVKEYIISRFLQQIAQQLEANWNKETGLLICPSVMEYKEKVKKYRFKIIEIDLE